MRYIDNYYYHVYNRGAHKQPIFFSPNNYSHCLTLIKKYKEQYGVAIIAYCLMPNHYHLLLRQETSGSISRFIQTTFNAYSQAVNKQIEHSGTLFQGKAKAILVDSDEYLIHLSRYIHLNPINLYPSECRECSEGLKPSERFNQPSEGSKPSERFNQPSEGSKPSEGSTVGLNWEYSSYKEWIGTRNEMLVDLSLRDVYFKTPQAYKLFVEKYVELHDKEKIKKYLFDE